MIEILKSILFGIIEGVTEWLPVSSTGHLILLNEFITLNMSAEFWEMFKVVIQFGAIMAVVVLFWNKLFPFRFKGGVTIKKDIFSMWFKIAVACIPAVIIGVGFDDILDKYLYNSYVVATMLILVGVLFIFIENANKNKRPQVTSISQITYKLALLIGVFQLVAAVLPGTSRSGATILGALMIGLSRKTAAEFTFFLAIPTMLGASLLKLVKFGFGFTSLEAAVLIVGIITSFIVSLFIIKFLLGYIKKHDFKAFAWYRIVLGCAVLLYFGVGALIK